jgi:hypothetical protein
MIQSFVPFFGRFTRNGNGPTGADSLDAKSFTIFFHLGAHESNPLFVAAQLLELLVERGRLTDQSEFLSQRTENVARLLTSINGSNDGGHDRLDLAVGSNSGLRCDESLRNF